MKFAVNYSPQAVQLLRQGRLQPDRFKCPDWPETIAEASILTPVAVHYNLRIGSGKIRQTNWEKISRLSEQTGTFFVNAHIFPSSDDFPGIPAHTPEPSHFQQVVDQLQRDVETLLEHFAPERIILENVPYQRMQDKVMRPAVEPAVLSSLLEQTGCGLLLDVSHAQISAHFLDIDARDYMDALPINRLREMHFTGVHNLNGVLQDHLLPQEEDWRVLEWALERIRSRAWANPWMLSFEYGGVGKRYEPPALLAADIEALADYGARLQALIRDV